MEYLFIGLFTLMAILFLLLVRNELVFNIRARRIDELNSESEFKKFDNLTYYAMLYDLTKWTYKQFYGDK